MFDPVVKHMAKRRGRASGRASPLDEIDRVLAEHYGFAAEELDFIINNDIKRPKGRATDPTRATLSGSRSSGKPARLGDISR